MKKQYNVKTSKTKQVFTKNAIKDAITSLNDVKPWGWVSMDAILTRPLDQLCTMMTYLQDTLTYPENTLPYLK